MQEFVVSLPGGCTQPDVNSATVITQAFQHCRGLGPIRLSQLTEAGVRSWHDALQHPHLIPSGLRAAVTAECKRCLQALTENNIQYFVDSFATQDKWRILTRYVDRCSYFDIETTGLEYDDTITVIACWHRDRLHTFVEHENLDDFLDLLDEVELLVSFNGSTFDVPRVLDGFHIPKLPCPHLDLRWPCYHKELNGGLKQVTSHLGLQRPDDLHDADGSLAVRLWSSWIHQKNTAARDQLVRYCAADVLLMVPLAEHLAGNPMTPLEQLWKSLPAANLPTEQPSANEQRKQFLATMFGSASPAKLRTRRSS